MEQQSQDEVYDRVKDLSLGIELSLVEKYSNSINDEPSLSREVTFQNSKNLPIHGWFQYTQGFSPGLVDHYISKWNIEQSGILLDPFVGSGTSLVRAQQLGFESVGWDLSPLAVFLSRAKTSEIIESDLSGLSQKILAAMETECSSGLDAMPDQIQKHLKKTFPDEVMQDILKVREAIDSIECDNGRNIAMVAFISSLEKCSYIRKHGSHYRFMNTTNTGVQREIDFSDIDYPKTFFDNLETISEEAIQHLKDIPDATVLLEDARLGLIEGELASFVITSPPYLNRNNYIAQSKMEMFLSGLMTTFDDYRDLTKRTLRSHVEADSIEGIPRLECPLVDQICETVLERGESYKGVSSMIRGYFDDIAAVMQNLSRSLSVGAKIAMSVGCSRWSGVVVPTDLLIAHHAVQTGQYKLNSVDVVRHKGNSPQQMAKWGRYPVRESVLLLERI